MQYSDLSLLLCKLGSMRIFFLVLFSLFMSVSGCKTNEVIIKGNTPPPDNTMEPQLINNFINRCYINLIDRKPTEAEKTIAFSELMTGGYTREVRSRFLNQLYQDPAYFLTLNNEARSLYLENISTQQIRGDIRDFNFLLNKKDNLIFHDLILKNKLSLERLLSVSDSLQSKKINWSTFNKAFVDNYAYDQINMGTDNFVRSCFQNFLLRYPTQAELTRGKIMVNGRGSSLFLKAGTSKEDFIAIFFSSPDYQEGQARYWFKKYMLREPNDQESIVLVNLLKDSDNLWDLQLFIFSSDEFAGVRVR